MMVLEISVISLIYYNWNRYNMIVEKAALNLFERLQKNGMGINTNYDMLRMFRHFDSILDN